jgi:hypothetical protein
LLKKAWQFIKNATRPNLLSRTGSHKLPDTQIIIFFNTYSDMLFLLITNKKLVFNLGCNCISLHRVIKYFKNLSERHSGSRAEKPAPMERNPLTVCDFCSQSVAENS